MELYKSLDDIIRRDVSTYDMVDHIKAVHEAEMQEYNKNALPHRAMKVILYIFLGCIALLAIYLMYLLYIRNGGWN